MIKKLLSLITAINKAIETLRSRMFSPKLHSIDTDTSSVGTKKRIIIAPYQSGRAYQIIGYPRPPRREHTTVIPQQPADITGSHNNMTK